MTLIERPNDATLRQIQAADPGVSTWLSANAGSGKTRVLTDRVARLLLHGTRPERILCLTYTKAAAAEMQNRLFSRLGEWAMQDDDTLRHGLRELGEQDRLAADDLARARTLFAQAIETPGGLKIQTIHAFSDDLLRRFPLEAGVSPGFTEMDERAADRLLEQVLDDLADSAQQGAVDAVAPYLGGDDGLMQLAKAVMGKREAFGGARPDIRNWFDLPEGLTEAGVLASAFDGSEGDLWAAMVPLLDPANRDQAAFLRECGALDWARPDVGHVAALEGRLLFGSGAANPFGSKAGRMFNAGLRKALGAHGAALDALCDRIEAARPLRLGLEAAARTEALYTFAEVLIPRMAEAKALRGWLDFDDLITHARRLLTDPSVAQWVLFRLDGGIDHILVDEAQDTSPAQWEIVRQLSAEFASGEGARADTPRTIFVVGDKKQSIYSFQGADPDGFDRMAAHFGRELSEVGAHLQRTDLRYSFRSARPILKLVDTVFAGPAGDGVGQEGEHIPFKADMPGRVDLWPPVPKAEKPEKAGWPRPVDELPNSHHTVILADRIVSSIRQMLEDRVPVGPPDKRRAVRPGDILILVRRRSGLYPPLASALKASGLPFAGADVFRVAADLAVKDLSALLRFLATADDDLSLAEALRSPLFGWSEDDLYRLAHPRGDQTLWQALRGRDDATVEALRDLRDQADFLRPYDLIERILIRHDGRRRLVQRLGPEAEEGIDALLAQALAYERAEVPSLLGFTGWLASGEVSVKRTLTGQENLIRLMTVHGAKGLEAPVVILPDAGVPKGGAPHLSLLAAEGGPVIWPPLVADMPARVAGLKEAKAEREAAERRRLLYVAMTRAENWLIVAAAGEPGEDPATSWYRAIEDAMTALGATRRPTADLGDVLRIETGDWTPAPAVPDVGNAQPSLPDWVGRPVAPPAPMPAPLSPSDLGGAKALPGEDGGTTATALARGRQIHAALEHLPAFPRDAWREILPGLLPDDPPQDPDALLAEAAALIDAPDLAEVFGPETLAEVAITGSSPTLGATLAGQIDRLIVGTDHVTAIDFKSNAVVPDTPDQIPEGLLRQLAAYAELLAPLYPDRQIRTAILWTRSARLMCVPPALTQAALSRAALS